MALIALPLYGHNSAIGIILSGDDNEKLKSLNKAQLSSKISYKATYASWTRCFNEGKGRKSGMNVEAFLAY